MSEWTDKALDRVEALADAATPGPWLPDDPWLTGRVLSDDECAWCADYPPIIQSGMYDEFGDGRTYPTHLHHSPVPFERQVTARDKDGWPVLVTIRPDGTGFQATEADNTLIVECREIIPSLIAEVRRLKAELAERTS